MFYLDPILAPRPAEQPKDAAGMGRDERIRFGSAVKAARQELGWSQAQLGAQVDMRQAYVSQIETGAVSITIDTMAKLAKALNRDIHELLKP